MNTQEIQEWDEDLETLLDHAVPQVVFEGVESLKKDIKSFISQKLKEQKAQLEERHKREIKKLQRYGLTEYPDQSFIDPKENGEYLKISDVLTLLSKY